MSVIIGIDIGGSTTKIVGFRRENMELIDPIFVHANDPITSIYGAFGKFTVDNNLELGDIEKIMMTGVGSSSITKPLYGLPCFHESEFHSIGIGGLYLSGLDEAIVVSMGTGTAIVHAQKKSGNIHYLGGTGVGGGTLMGLSKKILGMDEIEHIVQIAESGSLEHIDLKIKDIKKEHIYQDLSDELTASNFGKVSDMASKSDLALGIINLVFETVAMISIFAARNYDLRNIVLTGNLTTVKQAPAIFNNLENVFNVKYIIPEYSQFATVIGAALTGYNQFSGKNPPECDKIVDINGNKGVI